MSEKDGTGVGEIRERWSAHRKTDVVVRLLRGEAIDEVSRDVRVPVHELEEWRRVFLDTGTQGLKRRHTVAGFEQVPSRRTIADCPSPPRGSGNTVHWLPKDERIFPPWLPSRRWPAPRRTSTAPPRAFRFTAGWDSPGGTTCTSISSEPVRRKSFSAIPPTTASGWLDTSVCKT